MAKDVLVLLACVGGLILAPLPALLIGGMRGGLASALGITTLLAIAGLAWRASRRRRRFLGAALIVDEHGVADRLGGADTIPWSRIERIRLRRDDAGDAISLVMRPDAPAGPVRRAGLALGMDDRQIALTDLAYDTQAIADALDAFQQWANNRQPPT